MASAPQNQSGRCPTHDTDINNRPFSWEQQFESDWAGYRQYAVRPSKTKEEYRAGWEQRHPACT